MRISIIIPNYNGENLLKKNLGSVMDALIFYSKKDKGSEVIIVDDSSEDGSVLYLQNEFKNYKDKYPNIFLKLIVNNRNLGFSSTVNKGVKEAIGEIIILLNSDVRPNENFLEFLTAHFKDPEVFAVGCLEKSIEPNDEIILRGRGIGAWKRGFLIHKRGEVNRANTLWVNGGSGAFKKGLWEKLGGFDEIYNPFYWEDIDLSYRALKTGYKVIFEPKSVVIHEHSKGAIKKKFKESEIKEVAYRNQFLFVWKNADFKFQILHLIWLPYHFSKALLGRDISFFIGFLSAFKKLKKIIEFNFNNKKDFVKRDEEVVKEFYI